MHNHGVSPVPIQELEKPDGSLIMYLHEFDAGATIHVPTKMAVQDIFDWKTLEEKDDSSLKAMDLSHKSISSLPAPYCWAYVNTRNDQKERMHHTTDWFVEKSFTMHETNVLEKCSCEPPYVAK
jgi:hypothetical protein